jgi:hypothetical protein
MGESAALHTVLAADYLPAVLKDKKALLERLKVRAFPAFARR